MNKLEPIICNTDIRNVQLNRPMFMSDVNAPDGWVTNIKTQCKDILLCINMWEKKPLLLKCMCMNCLLKANIHFSYFKIGDPVGTHSRTSEYLSEHGYVGLYRPGKNQ